MLTLPSMEYAVVDYIHLRREAIPHCTIWYLIQKKNSLSCYRLMFFISRLLVSSSLCYWTEPKVSRDHAIQFDMLTNLVRSSLYANTLLYYMYELSIFFIPSSLLLIILTTISNASIISITSNTIFKKK